MVIRKSPHKYGVVWNPSPESFEQPKSFDINANETKDFIISKLRKQNEHISCKLASI